MLEKINYAEDKEDIISKEGALPQFIDNNELMIPRNAKGNIIHNIITGYKSTLDHKTNSQLVEIDDVEYILSGSDQGQYADNEMLEFNVDDTE